MERLEAKKINGRIYYFYSEWAWIDGKCRRVWQKYFGKLESILKAVDGNGPAPLYAEVFQMGIAGGVMEGMLCGRGGRND